MARRIEVEIVGDSRSLERAFKRSERSAQQFSRTVTKTSKSFSLLSAGAGIGAGVVGFQTLAGAAKAAFQEMENAAQVAAQTTAAIKSTGGAAGVTAKHVDELAQSMLKKTGIDDEAIKSSENMLMAFRQIRNETGKGNNIFDQATQAVADLATRMNKGAVPSAEQMQAASIRLGKALNDPVKGLGALARVGIQFTNQQKRQIAALVQSGHTVQAQKIILDQLTQAVGGAAEAAGKTLPGQLSIMREQMRNTGGDIAKEFTPAILDATGAILKLADAYVKARQKAKGHWYEPLTKTFPEMLAGQFKYFGKQWRTMLDFLEGKDSGGRRVTTERQRAQAAGFGDVLLTRAEALRPDRPSLRAARRPAARRGITAGQRNTWFDMMIGRQLGRVGDVGPGRQLERFRTIASELRKELTKVQDPTRRLNLQDQLLDVLKQERDTQQQITDNIKQGNQALRERGDAIKSAVLNQLQRGQTALENRQQLQDALRQLALARHIGGPMGIQAAARDVQKARFAISYAGLEAAPASLKGGRFAYGGVTVNVHGVTDPEKVARQVVAVLERRRRHTSTPTRGPTVDSSAPR